jgi:hypothetical protein
MTTLDEHTLGTWNRVGDRLGVGRPTIKVGAASSTEVARWRAR